MVRELQVDIALNITKAMRGLQRSIDDLASTIETRLEQAVSRGLSMQKSATKNPFKVYITEAEKTVAKINKIFDYIDLKKGINKQLESIKKVERALEILNRQYSQLDSGHTQAKTAAERQTLANIEDLIARTKSYKKELEDKIAAENINTMAQQAAKKEYKALEEAIDDVSFAIDRNIEKEKRRNAALAAANKQDIKKLGKEIDYETGGLDDIIANAQKKEQVEKKRLAAVLKAEQENFAKEMLLAKKSLENTIAIADKKIAMRKKEQQAALQKYKEELSLSQRIEKEEKRRLASVLKEEKDNFAKEMTMLKQSLAATIDTADKKIKASQKVTKPQKIITPVTASSIATGISTLNRFPKTTTEVKILDKEISKLTNDLHKLSKTADVSEDEIKNLGKQLDLARDRSTAFKNSINNQTNELKKNVGIIANWYNHFGRVALGFTIAYRAMNAFETGMRNTFNLVKEGIVLSGELTSLQAELATYYVLNTGNVNDFSMAMSKASANVQALAQASIQSVSTLDELSVGISELAQHNVLISPDNMKSFSAINDLLIQVAKATGDNAKQIRSEWGGLMDGQMKATNAFVRMLSSIGILDDKMIESLKGTGDKAKIIEEIFKRTEDAALRLQETLMRTNPALGFEKWKSSFSVAIAKAVSDASKELGTENIFGDILAKHIDGLNKTLFGQEQEDIKQSMLIIAEGFDAALTAMEEFVVGALKLSAWISQNRELLINLGKIFASYLILKEVAIAVGAAETGFKTFMAVVSNAPDKLNTIANRLVSITGLMAVIGLSLKSAYESAKDAIFIETFDLAKAKKDLESYKKTLDAAIKTDQEPAMVKQFQKNVEETSASIERFNRIVNSSATDLLLENTAKGWDDSWEWIKNKLTASEKEAADKTKALADSFGEGLKLPPGKAKEVTKSYEDALKEIGDLTTNFFSKLEKAIADSDFAAFDKLLAPTTKELEIKLRETREEYENLVALAASTPEGLLKDKLTLKGVETAKEIKEIQKQIDSLADSMQEAELAYFLEEAEKTAAKWVESTLTDLEKLKRSIAEIEDVKNFMSTDQYNRALDSVMVDALEKADQNKKAAVKVEAAWVKAAENIQDAWADLLTDLLTGEFSGLEDFTDGLAAAFASSFSNQFAAGLSKGIADGMLEADAAGTNLIAGALSGAASAANPWLLGGSLAMSGLGALLSDKGPSYGEMLSDDIKDLISALKENTQSLKDQLDGITGLDIAIRGLNENIYKKQFGQTEATLAGSFKIPEGMKKRSSDWTDAVKVSGLIVGNAVSGGLLTGAGLATDARVLDKGYTSYDYSKKETSAIIEQLAEKMGLSAFLNMMKETTTNAGALITALKENELLSEELPARVLQYYSNGSGSKDDRNRKVAEGIVEQLTNDLLSIGIEVQKIVTDIDSYVKSWDDRNLSAFDRKINEVNDALGQGAEYANKFFTAMLGENYNIEELLASIGNPEGAFADLMAMTGLTQEEIMSLIDAEKQWIRVTKEVSEEFEKNRLKIFGDMNREINVATGVYSGMEQTYMNIMDKAEEYRLQLIDQGATFEGAANAARNYAVKMKSQAFQAQYTADINDYTVQLLNAQGKSQEAVNLQRKIELQNIDKMYGAGTAAADAIKNLAEKIWELNDASQIKGITDSAQDIINKDGMSDLDKNIYDITKKYKEQFKVLTQLNGTVEDFNTLGTAMNIEIGNAREDYYNELKDFYIKLKEQIRDLIWDLQGGSLAPVQSMEGMAIRYQKLYEEALQTGDIDRFTSFISGEFVDFVKSYGNYGEVNARIIDDLNNLEDKLVNEASLLDVNSQLIDANMTLTDIADGIATLNQMLGAAKGFASGGNHEGGFRIVGETGRELEYTGPSRIFNSDSTEAIIAAMNGGSNGNVTVNITIGNEQVKNYIANVIRTDSETQKHIKRAARA